MKHIRFGVLSAMIVMTVAGCSTGMSIFHEKPATATVENPPEGTPEVQQAPALPPVTDSSIGGTYIGGAVEQSMDETDRSKMLHAMDKAPGKSTQWVNLRTQITYTVTPTKKVHIEDKSFCRQYQMNAVHANDKTQTVEGVACIASDGNWHILRD